MLDRSYYNSYFLLVYFLAVHTAEKGRINQNAKRVGLQNM